MKEGKIIWAFPLELNITFIRRVHTKIYKKITKYLKNVVNIYTHTNNMDKCMHMKYRHTDMCIHIFKGINNI